MGSQYIYVGALTAFRGVAGHPGVPKCEAKGAASNYSIRNHGEANDSFQRAVVVHLCDMNRERQERCVVDAPRVLTAPRGAAGYPPSAKAQTPTSY